jgi:predicted transcriptional regulator of viral defense system
MALGPQDRPPSSIKVDLAKLARVARGGVLSVQAAAAVLGLPQRAAAMRTAALARAGWLTRLRRGYYLVLPLEAASEVATTVEDPWVLAAALYRPGYIGGWSAAEHWGLTEQLFRSTFVVTAANIRRRSATYAGASFSLVRVHPDRLKHLTTVWRGSTRVHVSSRERTLVDAAIDPRWLGGFRHFADVFAAFADAGEADALLMELRRSGTGAAAKRIGYLAERRWSGAHKLIEGAYALRSAGVIKLDPSVTRRGDTNTRWGLWVNVQTDRAPQRSMSNTAPRHE